MVSRPSHPATRWSVVAVGLALVLAAMVDPLTTQTRESPVDVTLTTLLAIGVVLIGVYLAISPIRTRTLHYATAWTVLGALALTAAGAWTLGMHQVSADTARSIVTFELNAGALFGGLVGTMYVQNRHRAELLADERERLSFLNYLLRHNVLNGVQVVTAQTRALREETPDPTDGRIDVIESWTVGLGDLVSRMRQFLDASTGDRRLEPIPLGDVLDTEVAKVEGAFDATITRTGSSPAVTADDGLHQVFEGLLVDAAERSEAACPTIDVTTSQRGDFVVVDVASPDPMMTADGGAGFEPNTDGDPAGDLGFGRYLVATLVDYYGGTVDVGDQSDDVLYTIELPHAP